MILNMNQLRAFHLAAKLKSVTLAAQELMVTPPAITMQVKHLEETLGIKLMYRDGNALSLTDVGKGVFKRAEKIFGEIHEMENFLEDLSMAKIGELKIGCTQTPAKYVMPALIAKFKETHPGIKIILDQGSNSAEMVQSVLHHENELAIMRYRPDVKRLKIRMIGSEEVLLIAANKSRHLPGDEISITQLPELPLIVTKEGSGIRDVLFEYFRKFRVVPKISMESGSVDLIKEMVRRDSGISFMGKYAIEDELEKGLFRSVRILEGAPKIDFGIGYLQRKYLSPAAWAFLRVVDKAEEILPSLK